MSRINSPKAKDNSPTTHLETGKDGHVTDSNSPMKGNDSPMDNGDVAEDLIKWGYYYVFNSPTTKGNSPITHLGGSRDDNVADSNSPMRGNNSPIDRKEQGAAYIVTALCSHKVKRW